MHQSEYSKLLDGTKSTKSEKRNKISDVFEYDSMSVKEILPLRSEHTDDAVCHGIAKLSMTVIYCVSFWMFAYLMIMVQSIIDRHLPFLFSFIPMWIGTMYGLVSIVVILKNVFKNGFTLVTEERRLFMESEGISTEEYINFYSLPLLRKLLFWCFIIFFSLVMILTSQISFYEWLTNGMIGIWYSILPIIILYLSLSGYCFVLKTFSLSTCSILHLSAVELVSYHVHTKIFIEIKICDYLDFV